MTIAALVSGGVDSSVTVPKLIEQGYKPTIFYIKIGMEDKAGYMDCPSEEDIEITTYIAKKYDLKLEIVDLQEIYWERVVGYTLDEVRKGLTPNPDVMCNKMIKFGAFEELYGKDFDLITTGHYASTKVIDGKKYLATAADKRKDQTYFLGQITHNQLKKLYFPIGDLQKSEVRRLAEEMKLPSAHRPDSQGICFLGKINYNDFIKKYVGEKKGDVIELETGKKLGQHNGYWFHTIGQRRGLGLSQGPWFVVKKDIEQNIIFVSNGYDPISQYGSIVDLKHFHWINDVPDQDYTTEQRIKFKIRHTPDFTAGTLVQKGDAFILNSNEPIAGIAAGQFGVIYNDAEELCLGSGIIS